MMMVLLVVVVSLYLFKVFVLKTNSTEAKKQRIKVFFYLININ